MTKFHLAPPSSRSRLRRAIFLCAAALLTVVTAVAGSITLVCVFKPDLVTASVQQHLIDATGLPWRIRGSIRPSFSRGIGIVAKDVQIIAATTEQGFYANSVRPLVHAKSLRIVLDLVSLFEFKPMTKLIELDEPTVNLVYDGMGRPLWQPPEPDESFTVKADPAVNFQSVANAVCAQYNIAMQPVVIHEGTFVSYTREGKVLLSLSGIEGSFDPTAQGNNLELAAAFDLPGADLSVTFSLEARVGEEGIPARGSLKGGVFMTPPRSRTITADFVTSFTWQPSGKDISLPDFTLSAEGDLLSANLAVDLSLGTFTGPVAIHTLSLPRWFEWARMLPPGLQQALHGLSGSFDLDMNLTMAMARNLNAHVGNLRLTGSVGAPDFAAPSVVCHVDVAETPDLDALLPFLGVPGVWIPEPKAPVFDHPSLAPYPEDPPAPYDSGPSSVGYDINIALQKAIIHGVQGGPLAVRITPHMAGKVEKTRVAINGKNLLSGSATGYLDITKDIIRMHYEVKDADLSLLPENKGSAVRIAGKATGSCDIDMPMDKNGTIVDDWPLRIDAEVKNCEIFGTFRKQAWKLHLTTAKAKGSGSIYAVLEKGVRLSGNWDIQAAGIRTPWQPKASDSLHGNYTGTLHWPPIQGGPPSKNSPPEKKSVARVDGNTNVTGSVILPDILGAFSLAGGLTTHFDWNVGKDHLRFTGSEFKGHGSVLNTDAEVDLSGAQNLVSASPNFTINPAKLLRDWQVTMPQALRVPGLFNGRLDLQLHGDTLNLDKIKVEMDGAPLSGSIVYAPEHEKGRAKALDKWTLRLAAQHLDIEKIFPPDTTEKAPPKASPWQLDAFSNLSLDAQITLHNAKKGKLSFDRSTVTALFHSDRFSVECDTQGFYGGTSLIVAQGTIVPGSSQVTLRKGLIHMQKVSLGALLYDMTGKRSYAGTAELVADLKGVLGSNADIPGKLSGNWSLNIKDGLYPGFLTSEDSTLRNTFSLAQASGPMENGVLRSNNFRLSGTMVDMTGGGWYDLRNSTMDMEVSVTFAKVPTVPVRFYGSAKAPRMKVRGVDMVVETVQAAGSTIFGLVMGVLELPGQAVQGISSIFGTPDKKPGKEKSGKQRPPQTMPIRPVGQ